MRGLKNLGKRLFPRVLRLLDPGGREMAEPLNKLLSPGCEYSRSYKTRRDKEHEVNSHY